MITALETLWTLFARRAVRPSSGRSRTANTSLRLYEWGFDAGLHRDFSG
jgi:hypothetical protein